MELNKLEYTKGSRGHKRRTYGRGFSSGLGKTSGRGQKGQHSRKSGNVRIGFEGGQTPIYRKIPKVGFNSYNFRTNYNVVNIDMIIAKKLTDVNYASLVKAKLIEDNKQPIKVIGGRKKINKIDSKITFKVDKVTASLKKELEALGCTFASAEKNKTKETKKN
mgnify:CR=1 FL=1